MTNQTPLKSDYTEARTLYKGENHLFSNWFHSVIKKTDLINESDYLILKHSPSLPWPHHNQKQYLIHQGALLKFTKGILAYEIAEIQKKAVKKPSYTFPEYNIEEAKIRLGIQANHNEQQIIKVEREVDNALLDNLVFEDKKNNDALLTNSRIIAGAFDKEHFHVMEAIRNMECSVGFYESNFRLSSYNSQQNKEQPMYNITEEGFMRLVMGFTGQKAAEAKEEFIAAFQAMRKSLSPKVTMGVDLKELHAYIEASKEMLEIGLAKDKLLITAKEEIQEKNSVIEMNAPKVNLYDRLISSKESNLMSKICKLWGIGSTRFSVFLRDQKICMKRGKTLLPYQNFVDEGFFVIKEKCYQKEVNGVLYDFFIPQMQVTGKGVAWLEYKYGDHLRSLQYDQEELKAV